MRGGEDTTSGPNNAANRPPLARERCRALIEPGGGGDGKRVWALERKPSSCCSGVREKFCHSFSRSATSRMRAQSGPDEVHEAVAGRKSGRGSGWGRGARGEGRGQRVGWGPRVMMIRPGDAGQLRLACCSRKWAATRPLGGQVARGRRAPANKSRRPQFPGAGGEK